MKIKSFKDNRGEMKFIQNIDNKNKHQTFISINHKNVIRGIHTSPYSKLITVLSGSIIDYVINFEDSSIYSKRTMYENDVLEIPANCGHLFISLEDNTSVLYQLNGEYNEKFEKNYNYRCPYINLDIDNTIEYIVSEKDKISGFKRPVDYILLGSSGFLGSYTYEYFTNINKNIISISTRLDDHNSLYENFKFYKPKYVICAAGISGKPSIKWCEESEDNKHLTYMTNYVSIINLAKICKDLFIHLTIYGSGLIYSGNKVYNETDKPNKKDMYYSRLRIQLENDLNFSNVLYLRMLYPIVCNNNPKCLLSKLENFRKVNDIKVNVTILPSLMPLMVNMIDKNIDGIFNFVNHGLISLVDILDIYDSDLEYIVVKSDNDNAPELDVTKLKKLNDNIDINVFNCLKALML